MRLVDQIGPRSRSVLGFMFFVAVIVAVALVSVPLHAATGSWGASPQSPPKSQRDEPFMQASRGFDNETLRQIVQLSAGGGALQIRLSNEFGTAALTIGEARIALVGRNQTSIPGTDHLVTFARESSVVIPPGETVVSDWVPLPVKNRASVAVSLWFPADTGPVAWHPFAMTRSYITAGNTTADRKVSARAGVTRARFVMTRIDVDQRRPGGSIVAFGDSLTDGVGSTGDANRRYPDLLAEKLAPVAIGKEAVGVVNAGLGGNRLLNDFLGEAGISRFERDVLGVPGVTRVIVLEGINDIGYASLLPRTPVTAEQLIEGYSQLIRKAHDAGVKIYGGTLTPFGGAFYYSPEGEAIRQAVNQWIRTSGAFDDVIDFDAAVQDPADPARLLPAFDSGDGLHMNDAGYEVMAQAAYDVLRSGR